MPVEPRGQAIRVMINLVNRKREEPPGCGGGRQLSLDGTSRVTGDCHARICERLGVKSPGATRRTAAGFVFDTFPQWVIQEIPGSRGAWAPDISYFNGRFHLYYAISTFGSQNSAIGLATNKTLNPASADYHWSDEGLVLSSYQGKDDWNAIDPN